MWLWFSRCLDDSSLHHVSHFKYVCGTFRRISSSQSVKDAINNITRNAPESVSNCDAHTYISSLFVFRITGWSVVCCTCITVDQVVSFLKAYFDFFPFFSYIFKHLLRCWIRRSLAIEVIWCLARALFHTDMHASKQKQKETIFFSRYSEIQRKNGLILLLCWMRFFAFVRVVHGCIYFLNWTAYML